jgi:hypothetical protein
MTVRLKYRQGSFSREELRDSEHDAILRAGELIYGRTGCELFEIRHADGWKLKNDFEIRRAYKQLTAARGAEPTPPEAA